MPPGTVESVGSKGAEGEYGTLSLIPKAPDQRNLGSLTCTLGCPNADSAP